VDGFLINRASNVSRVGWNGSHPSGKEQKKTRWARLPTGSNLWRSLRLYDGPAKAGYLSRRLSLPEGRLRSSPQSFDSL